MQERRLVREVEDGKEGPFRTPVGKIFG